MFQTIFALYVIIHVTNFAYSFRWGDNSSNRLWFLRLMLAGMIYDNAMLFLGQWFTQEDWYLRMNYPRYFLHVAVLPFMTIFVLTIMQRARIALAMNKWFIGFCWTFVTWAWWWGVTGDVLFLDLVPGEIMGYPKMMAEGKMPPIATIATNILLLPMTFMLWRATGWLWTFAGTLFILIINGAFGPQEWGILTGNGAEVIFISCLLATERHFLNYRPAAA